LKSLIRYRFSAFHAREKIKENGELFANVLPDQRRKEELPKNAAKKRIIKITQKWFRIVSEKIKSGAN
jgi:hypothetical protein